MVTDSKTSVLIIKKNVFHFGAKSVCSCHICGYTYFCYLSSVCVCVCVCARMCVCVLSKENQTCSGRICTLDEARFVQAHLLTPVLPQC